MNTIEKIFIASGILLATTLCSCREEDPIEALRPDWSGVKAGDGIVKGKDIDNIMTRLLDQTDCTNPDDTRMALIGDVQEFCDACSKAYYDTYYATATTMESNKLAENTILHYYRGALDRVLDELTYTVVPQGKLIMWHLYNMGYVVKTPSHTFGIDIKHKNASELVPYLDFLLITHKHVDHYSDELNSAMRMAGKPVYSNFVENEYMITAKRNIKVVDDIEMAVGLGDHSATQRNFCVCYQVDCGADTGHKTIYHVGDTYNATQLAKTRPIDIFIVHSGINMNFTQAMNKIAPTYTLLSHVDELSHAIDNYRWPYDKAFNRADQLEGSTIPYIPVWGERIEF